jgi:hypothetical protein
MHRPWSPLWVCFLLVVLSSPLAANEPSPPPVEAFGAVPQVREIHVSPDGRTLAWLDESQAPRIVMFDIATRQERRSVRVEPP